MARIRTIKPSFWGSRAIVGLTRDARLLAIGLISMADDDGRFLGSITAINGYVFPNDELPHPRIRRWLNELTNVGLIHEYECTGVKYACFPSWHEHQVINRYTPSVLPEPDVPCHPRNTKKQGDTT